KEQKDSEGCWKSGDQPEPRVRSRLAPSPWDAPLFDVEQKQQRADKVIGASDLHQNRQAAANTRGRAPSRTRLCPAAKKKRRAPTRKWAQVIFTKPNNPPQTPAAASHRRLPDS